MPSSVKISEFPEYMPVSKAAIRAFFDASVSDILWRGGGGGVRSAVGAAFNQRASKNFRTRKKRVAHIVVAATFYAAALS